jgi:hypothetical protein
MRIIISERQYETLKEQTKVTPTWTNISPKTAQSIKNYATQVADKGTTSGNNSTNLNLKGVKAVNVPVKKELSPEQIKADQQMGHYMNAVLQMVTVFIPYIGPYISTTIGAADAQLYWNEGDYPSAALASVFALLPGIGGALSTKIPGIKALGQEGMNKLASKIIKGEKTLTPLESQVTKQIGKESQLIKSEVKKVLSLEKNSIKTPKVARDYGIIKISNNLELITKPRWKEYVAQVKSLKNPEDFMDLKKGVDELGDYYYMSTKMSNPIDAGKAFQKLIEYIPKGARFVEKITGSLSTDSFYSMLRRVKTFQPIVVGEIRMNSSGVKRFQDLITNTVKSNEFPPILTFEKSSDAAPLINALNYELEKAGITASATVSKNADGLWEVLIPNIQFIVK